MLEDRRRLLCEDVLDDDVTQLAHVLGRGRENDLDCFGEVFGSRVGLLRKVVVSESLEPANAVLLRSCEDLCVCGQDAITSVECTGRGCDCLGIVASSGKVVRIRKDDLSISADEAQSHLMNIHTV